MAFKFDYDMSEGSLTILPHRSVEGGVSVASTPSKLGQTLYGIAGDPEVHGVVGEIGRIKDRLVDIEKELARVRDTLLIPLMEVMAKMKSPDGLSLYDQIRRLESLVLPKFAEKVGDDSLVDGVTWTTVGKADDSPSGGTLR